MPNQCTNCLEWTADIDDIHCRKIFKNEIDELLGLKKLEEAEKLVEQTKFESDSTEAWKNQIFKGRPDYLDLALARRQERQSADKKRMAHILLAIENKGILNKEDLDFLEGNQNFDSLAVYHLERFSATNDLWQLSLSSKFFRKDQNPQKAIEIIDKISDLSKSTPDAFCAVLTSRGGAFRDLHNLEQAKSCAEEAIEINPKSYFPYTLLGAILMEEKNFEEGMLCFDKATELGAPPSMKNYEIKNIMTKSSADVKSGMAEYLLSNYPIEYNWVKKYKIT